MRSIMRVYLYPLGTLHSEMDALASQLPEYETVMNLFAVGKVTGSQLIAEIGDVTKLKSGKSLVALAGGLPLRAENDP